MVLSFLIIYLIKITFHHSENNYSDFIFFFQSSAVLAGLSLAAIGFGGRYLLRRAPDMSKKITEAMKTFPTAESFATSKYYRGGFEAKMNRREASLILGVSPTAPKTKVIEIFPQLMLLYIFLDVLSD